MILPSSWAAESPSHLVFLAVPWKLKGCHEVSSIPLKFDLNFVGLARPNHRTGFCVESLTTLRLNGFWSWWKSIAKICLHITCKIISKQKWIINTLKPPSWVILNFSIAWRGLSGIYNRVISWVDWTPSLVFQRSHFQQPLFLLTAYFWGFSARFLVPGSTGGKGVDASGSFLARKIAELAQRDLTCKARDFNIPRQVTG